MVKVEQDLNIQTYSSVFSSSSSSSQAVRLSAGVGGVCAFICGLFGLFLFLWSISAEPTREDLLLEILEQLQTKHTERQTDDQPTNVSAMFTSPAGISPGQVQSFHAGSAAAVRMLTEVNGQAGGVGVRG